MPKIGYTKVSLPCDFQDFELMNKFVALTFTLIIALAEVARAETSSNDNAVLENASALLTRQQQRMDILEAGLKEVRGILENDLREIKMKVEQMQNSSSEAGSSQTADLIALRDQMEKLSDVLAMTNRRMERTLEIASDTEFRLLRLEKRMQTLLALGGEDAAAALVQQDSTGVGEAAPVQMSRDIDTGISSWSVEESALNDALAVVESGSDKVTDDPSATNLGDDTAVSSRPLDDEEKVFGNRAALTSADKVELLNVPAQPEVLPAVSPEEQYRFALGRALQNDLETAQLAFSEFREFNKGHEREADSIFWLGRVYFMRGEYEKAAMTFSEFNSAFPGDARLVDTTMWIAESVSHFAPPAQACEIYTSLPQLIDTPPETFLAQLSKLSDDANCSN